MTLTTLQNQATVVHMFQMPVRSMTLTTHIQCLYRRRLVSDACQINDFDHLDYVFR